MILGAQLYTVRQFAQNEKDFDLTLQRVAAIGYTTVQISGIGNIPPATVRALCDKHGLRIVLTHVDANRLLNDTEALIREHDILGCDYIGIGSMPDRYRHEAWMDRFAADYREPAKKIAAAGKLMMYHNHDFEFAMVRGKRVMEYLIEGFAPEEMGFTLDTYWLQNAGCDVGEWIARLKGRLPCVHLKDMDVKLVSGASRVVMAPVGEGNMNFAPLLEAFAQAGTKYLLVEQDTCLEDEFVCLEKSYKHVAKLGYK